MPENTEQDPAELLHLKRNTPPFRYRDQACVKCPRVLASTYRAWPLNKPRETYEYERSR
jgi:hypothetical protein